MRGYNKGYDNWLDLFYTDYYNYLFTGGGGGFSGSGGSGGFTISWETKYTFTNGSTQVIRDDKGNIVEIRLPEIGIGYSRGSVTVGGNNPYNYGISGRAVTQSQGDGYNVDNAVNLLNGNSHPTYADAKAAGDGASCARFIRYSLEAGLGLKHDALLGKTPVPARQYGSFLTGIGFSPVNTSIYLRGDIAVFQGYPGGTSDANGIPYGHIQMYNGTQWLSNFKQNNFWPGPGYRTYQPTFEIYRWGYYP